MKRTSVRLSACLVSVAISPGLCAALGSGPAQSGQAASPSPEAARAVERGLGFVQQDSARWKAERKCATCHHGTMTLWALSEAKRQGYEVAAAYLSETMQWTKERLAGIEKPRDPRPGWEMINTPALYLAAMARHQPGQEILSAPELRQIANHAARHLESDGSVLTPATMSPPRPVNGPPPIFESREVLTLLAVLAMLPHEPPGPEQPATVRDGYRKASEWLAAATTGADTQSMALRLLITMQQRKPRNELRTAIDQLLARQRHDGGWGQLRDLASDAFATGQTLYVLSLVGVDRRQPAIRRGVAFLVANQRADGSWPMTPRAHPGAKPSTNSLPIGHFGSCWAVLGLVRTVPGEHGNIS